MSESILKVSGLTKKFGKLTAVDRLDFSIEKGRVYGLLGPNGSGKSTTLGMVLNVVNKTSGQIEWFGGQMQTKQALKHTGAIIERPNFYPYMTARQNLELVCKIKEITTDTIEEKLELTGLLDRQFDKFKTYSLGMKQRLAIASALLNNPEFLILDEPTNGLDPEGIHQIRTIIEEIARQGTTIILASHLLDEVEKVCDEVIILQKGKKIYDGSVKSLQKHKTRFEIQTDDMARTQTVLQDFPGVKNIQIQNNLLWLFPAKDDLSGSEINRYLVANNIYLESIVKKQPRLEELFLQLTEKLS